MAEFGELASAFVRIRPDLAGFRQELQSGIKTSFREIGTLHVPGLQGAKDDFASVVTTAKASATAINQSSGSVIASERARTAAILDTARAAKAGSVDQAQAYQAAAQAAIASSVKIELAQRQSGKTALLGSQTELHAAQERVKAALLVAAANREGSAEQIAAYKRAGEATDALLAADDRAAAGAKTANEAIVSSARESVTELKAVVEETKVQQAQLRRATESELRGAGLLPGAKPRPAPLAGVLGSQAESDWYPQFVRLNDLEQKNYNELKNALLHQKNRQLLSDYHAAQAQLPPSRQGTQQFRGAVLSPTEQAGLVTQAKLLAEQQTAYGLVGEAARESAAVVVASSDAEIKSNIAKGASANAAADETIAATRKVRTAREQEVRDTVAGQIVERRSLLETLAAARALAQQSVKGSIVQVEANKLAAQSAEQLGVRLTVAERRASSANAEFSRLSRGAIAGSGAFRGLGRSVAFASLSFIGAYGFIGVIRSALKDAGELNNEVTRSQTVFGGAGPSAQKWAADVGHGLELAKSDALGAVNTFGTLFNAVGLGQKQSAAFAEDVTKVATAASLAAGQADPTRAFEAFRAGLSGRVTYALRQYGIVLDQTLLKSKAIELGLVPTTADPTKVALAQRKVLEATEALQEARLKGSPLQQARAEDAVTAAQANLRKQVQGTTGALSDQAKAVAAHALIVEQGAKAVSRYGASLQTSAGQSRSFHEGVKEIKEELGGALYPTFAEVTSGIDSYIRSLEEGGKRHQQFEQDLHDVTVAGKDFYEILRVLAKGFDLLSTAVGGVGNLVEILGLLYATNKMLNFYAAVRQSRLGLILLGEQSSKTAGVVTTAEAEMGAGALTLRGRLLAARAEAGGLLGTLARLGKIGTVAIAIDLLINKDDRKRATDFYTGKNESTVTRVGLDIATLGGHEIIRHFFGGARAEIASQPNLLDSIVKSVKHDIDELGKLGQGPSSTPQTIARALAAVAKQIDDGGKLTKARATLLSNELTAIVATIADSTFSGETKAKLVARANELAIALATAMDSLGSKTIDSLEKSRAAIRDQLKKIGQDIAQQKADMQTAISDAITSASQAERDAVEQAKANLNSLGASLADFINRFVDAQQAKAQTAPTGPLAKRLKELTDLIHAGKGTPEIIQKAKEVEAELNAQQAKGATDQTKRKERITRRLADLTDELNTGKIGIRKFNSDVTALLRSEGINYRNAGKVLGVAFADGFRIALQEIRAQALAIQQTPAKLRGTSTGLETQIIKPLDVIKEQNKNIAHVEEENQRKLRDLILKRHELLLKEQSKSNEIAKLQRARLIELARSRAGLRAITQRAQGPGPLKPEVVPPGELARLKRAHDEQFQFRAKANDREIQREIDRVRRFVLERGTVLAKLKISTDTADQRRAVTLAHEGGQEIGRGLADGIRTGTQARLRELAQTAARAVLTMIRSAKIAGKIKSPSELTRDEIGSPLVQGVEVALEGAGLRLGETLAAQIRETVRRSKVSAAEREIASQGLGVGRGELERAVTGRPGAPRSSSSILDREAIRQATGHPAAAGGLLHRGELTIATSQRNLLLGEERKHTRLLEQIVSEEKKQTVLLRTERPHLPKVNVHKRTDGASKEATATAIHNLLGS